MYACVYQQNILPKILGGLFSLTLLKGLEVSFLALNITLIIRNLGNTMIHLKTLLM